MSPAIQCFVSARGAGRCDTPMVPFLPVSNGNADHTHAKQRSSPLIDAACRSAGAGR
jgi:hypothetical protein